MPLDLPNLDDLTWQELTELGRASIPGWAPEWTNHNAADPGITLVELFAYLSEILIYRLNRVSAANMRAFLSLINGPEWKLPQDIADVIPHGTDLDQAGIEKARLNKARIGTLQDLRETRRAVTADDFERLAIAAAPESVARAKAVFGRDLTADNISADAPGHVSVVIVAKTEGGFADLDADLLGKVHKTLEPARLLTTRLHVVAPRFVKFGVHATLVTSTSVSAEKLRADAVEALKGFFAPLEDEPRAKGWPFGRSIYVSDVYELLSRLPGVRRVTRSVDHHTGKSIEELSVLQPDAGRRRLNQDGKLEAIHVDPDELVRLEIREADIVVVQESVTPGTA